MKKAIIVTVYNSENCGSFLQAFALMKTLNSLCYQVRFLKRDIKNTSHDYSKTVKGVLRSIYNLNISRAFRFCRQWYNFESAQRNFIVCVMNDRYYKESDLIVLGSDTIWNFQSAYFKQNVSKYTGADFYNKKVISYAASVGDTSFSVFRSAIEQFGNLSNIKRILVRDSQTQGFVKSVVSFAPQIVCDPTLLLKPCDYKQYEVRYPYKQKCLVLYCFNDIEIELRKKIISYAHENDLKLVSLAGYFEWVDKNPDKCPENFITYYANAHTVVTDTFHGTAFALNYSIPFVAIDRGKIKVKELLASCNSTYRLLSNYSEFDTIVKYRNMEEADNAVTYMRDQSYKILKETLTSI